jgi:hypothetical protein
MPLSFLLFLHTLVTLSLHPKLQTGVLSCFMAHPALPIPASTAARSWTVHSDKDKWRPHSRPSITPTLQEQRCHLMLRALCLLVVQVSVSARVRLSLAAGAAFQVRCVMRLLSQCRVVLLRKSSLPLALLAPRDVLVSV